MAASVFSSSKATAELGAHTSAVVESRIIYENPKNQLLGLF